MLHKDVLIRLCKARDLLRETEEWLLVPQVAREIGMSPVSFHSLVQGSFWGNAQAMPTQRTVGKGQTALARDRDLRHRHLYGGWILQPGNLQLRLRAARGDDSNKLPAKVSSDDELPR